MSLRRKRKGTAKVLSAGFCLRHSEAEAPGRGGARGAVAPPMFSRTTFLILLIPA